MDPKLFATVFATIFVAELGDKTQLATLLYASDASHPRLTVFVASAAALVLASGLAVVVGSQLALHVNPKLIRWLAGLGFIAVGIWVLLGAGVGGTVTARDERPGVWVGHVTLHARDIPATRDFMVSLGMRPIADGEGFAVLELRGGTHLVVLPAEGADDAPGAADFDLMVDDLEATHAELRSLGLSPSPIQRGRIHHSFRVTAPSGHEITFNSSHVSDRPV